MEELKLKFNSNPIYVCKKCGYRGPNNITLFWAEDNVSDLLGYSKKKMYCFECYAKWLAENVPELVGAENEDNG